MKNSPWYSATLAVLAAALSMLAAVPAQAVVIGYTLDIFGGLDGPTFRLTNDSSAADLTHFNFTIGDTSQNFDSVVGVVAGAIVFTLNRPDANSLGGARSDDIDIDFTANFTPGSAFQFNADLDPDSFDTDVDFRTIFFNNGANPNSVITVDFGGLGQLSLMLPENPSQVQGSGLTNHYRFPQQAVAAVPEPSTLLLLGTGLIALIV